MKDGEKGLLALAVVGGFLYWGKFNPSGGISSRTPQIPSGPAIATRFSENSKGVIVYRQPDDAQELVRPKTGGIHNALKPVASSVPSQRPLKY